MLKSKKILIVDDDIELISILKNYLNKYNFYVKNVINSIQMQRLLIREIFHLIILDLVLPGEDGLSVCKRLRSEGNFIPIIMVTAKTDDIDRVIGLEIGADDYISKPFNPRELLARIRSLLRRQSYETSNISLFKEEIIVKFGDCKLNLITREMFKNNKKIFLTSSEFSILKVLIHNAKKPLSREKLMFLARGKEYNAIERSIDVQISRLRRLIEKNSVKPRYIQTVWGLGYVFVPDNNI